MQAKFVALAAVLLFALAGCSSKEPTGKLESLNFATPVMGKADLFYQPFANSNQASGLPSPANSTLQCAQGSDPTGQLPVAHCKGPYTTISVTMSDLFKEGTGQTYQVSLTGPGKAPLAIGTLAGGAGSPSNVTVAKNVTADLSGKYDKVEVRLNDFLYAVASAGSAAAPAAGSRVTNALTLAPGVNAVTVTGTYTGHHLEVMVANLAPTNETYMGMLYMPNADGTAQSAPTESFAIKGDGTVTYDSQAHAISDFVQFHIHVGESKLNLYKAHITPNP